MIRHTTLFILCFSLLILLSNTSDIRAQNTLKQQKDSLSQALTRVEGAEKLQTYSRLGALYLHTAYIGQTIDTLFTLYDEMGAEARRQNNLTYQGTAQTNKLIALSNIPDYDELFRQAPATLEFLAQNQLWRNYYYIRTLIAEAYRRRQDYPQAMDEAEAIYEYAREQQHKGGMGMAFQTIARIYTSQRRNPEAEQSLRESIQLLKDSTSYLNVLTTACYDLTINLIAQKRYEDALQAATQCEEVIHRYEEASGGPKPTGWVNLFRAYCDIYNQSGQYDKAEMYLDKLDSINGGSIEHYEKRAQVLYGKKEYDKALKMVEKAIETTQYKLQPKGLKLMILIEMGEAQEAYNLFSEVVAELRSENKEEINTKMDELRTRYEVDKHVAEKERNRNYFLFALAGCILLFILLAGMYYYNRVITRKNRGLYRRIKEQDRLEEQLRQMTLNYETLAHPVLPVEKEKSQPGDTTPDNRQQRELVNRLHEYLIIDRNFAKAETTRDELISALGTNKNLLSEAVKSITGTTLMEYIRTMQLEEARRMLDHYPELTIEAIAFDCGFNASNTFYRQFRKYYEISPAEYRKIAIEQQQQTTTEQ